MLAAAAAGCLAGALALDIAGTGRVAADSLGAAGLVLLVVAVIFPRWPRR